MCARNSLNSAEFWSFIYQNVIKNNTVHDRLENYYLHLRILKNKKEITAPVLHNIRILFCVEKYMHSALLRY